MLGIFRFFFATATIHVESLRPAIFFCNFNFVAGNQLCFKPLIKAIIMLAKSNQHVFYRTEIIISALFLFAALVCFIVNYSVDHFFSWSLYPAGALLMVWFVVMPSLVLKKNKVTGAFVGLGITLVPFLLLVQWLVPVKGWFIPLALPLALLVLSALGFSLIAFRFLKSKLYAAAVIIFIFGVIVNYGVGIIIKNYLPYSGLDQISRMSTIAAAGILSVLRVITGSIKKSVTNK